MNLDYTGLILEGGGLRGVYSSGVLSFFMEKNLFFPYIIGVSMGACNAANYVSRQPEKNRIVNITYVNDSRYMSCRRIVTHGELFGMHFIFNTIPYEVEPFDLKTFIESKQQYVIVVTDCITGQPHYYEKKQLGIDFLKILQASSSLPFVTKPVYYKGQFFMDGGLSDAIPIRKSIDDGNTRHVLSLTREKGYRKKPWYLEKFTRFRYPRFRGLCQSLETRSFRYNEVMDFLDDN